MPNRGDSRHSMRLQTKLMGTDDRGNRFVQTVFTRDVSARGACLTEVPPLLCTAAVIHLEYRGKKSRFRVVWVGGFASDEVGVVSLEPHHCIWDRLLPGRLAHSAR